MSEYFENSQEHLFNELLLVDLFIHAQVIKFRMENRESQNKYNGLYISEEEIDVLINHNSVSRYWSKNPENMGDEYQKILKGIKTINLHIEEKLKNTRARGISLNLIKLRDIFKLNSLEMKVLCICLAPQFDSKYRKLFAYLQNDVTRKNPSVELILNLICLSFKDKVDARSLFTGAGPPI
jgi:hypothetical protein